MPAVSFRDPAGFVMADDARVVRIVRPDVAENLFRFLASLNGQALVQDGDFIACRRASERVRDEVLREVEHQWPGAVVIEHDPVWFPSYPYEWPRAMLRSAALLTLDVAERLLPDGYGLKDATPFNVLFRGPEPVFVDALSVEARDPQDALWRPLSQFLQTFLYPLVLAQANGVPVHETLLCHREGPTPGEIYGQLNALARLRNLRWVCFPKWLSRESAVSYKSRKVDPELAAYSLGKTFRALRRAVEAIPESADAATAWSGYSEHCHYEQSAHGQKREFVTAALRRFTQGQVLDLGANDGEYSALAARAGHRVAACDLDPVSVNRLWERARAERLAILPLVVNLASPTPATGWGNQERRSFIGRAAGRFDCVLMLALLHHLTVTERVPTPMVLDTAAALTRRWLVVEWVSPNDPYYQKLLRGRDELHASDTQAAFEDACRRRFSIVEQQPLLEGRRHLYLLAKR